MVNITRINDDIHRITLPYKDIFTTVCTIRTQQGVLLFDAGSYDRDAEQYTLPFLDQLGITAEQLKYVFISHGHTDHAGGLKELARRFPKAVIAARSPAIREEYGADRVAAPEDGEKLLGVLRVVAIPGHTMDCAALLDERMGTLISGDCLQLYGIYGSGDWGSNISFPRAYLDAIERVRGLDVRAIVAAHDYQPTGWLHTGAEAVSAALDACVRPMENLRRLIQADPAADDEEIRRRYNASGDPPLRLKVVAAMRAMLTGEA